MKRTRKTAGTRILASAALALLLGLAGCSNPDKETRDLVEYTGSGPAEQYEIARPEQEISRGPEMPQEKREALKQWLQFIEKQAEQERARAQRMRARDRQLAYAERQPGFWRRVYDFPLLFTGLSAASGALIGSTRGHAWEGALIGTGVGALFDTARASRRTYPFGAGTILGTGIGAAVGSRSGSTAGGAIIGAGAGLVLDALIAADAANEPR